MFALFCFIAAGAVSVQSAEPRTAFEGADRPRVYGDMVQADASELVKILQKPVAFSYFGQNGEVFHVKKKRENSEVRRLSSKRILVPKKLRLKKRAEEVVVYEDFGSHPINPVEFGAVPTNRGNRYLEIVSSKLNSDDERGHKGLTRKPSEEDAKSHLNNGKIFTKKINSEDKNHQLNRDKIVNANSKISTTIPNTSHLGSGNILTRNDNEDNKTHSNNSKILTKNTNGQVVNEEIDEDDENQFSYSDDNKIPTKYQKVVFENNNKYSNNPPQSVELKKSYSEDEPQNSSTLIEDLATKPINVVSDEIEDIPTGSDYENKPINNYNIQNLKNSANSIHDLRYEVKKKVDSGLMKGNPRNIGNVPNFSKLKKKLDSEFNSDYVDETEINNRTNLKDDDGEDLHSNHNEQHFTEVKKFDTINSDNKDDGRFSNFSERKKLKYNDEDSQSDYEKNSKINSDFEENSFTNKYKLKIDEDSQDNSDEQRFTNNNGDDESNLEKNPSLRKNGRTFLKKYENNYDDLKNNEDEVKKTVESGLNYEDNLNKNDNKKNVYIDVSALKNDEYYDYEEEEETDNSKLFDNTGYPVEDNTKSKQKFWIENKFNGDLKTVDGDQNEENGTLHPIEDHRNNKDLKILKGDYKNNVDLKTIEDDHRNNDDLRMFEGNHKNKEDLRRSERNYTNNEDSGILEDHNNLKYAEEDHNDDLKMSRKDHENSEDLKTIVEKHTGDDLTSAGYRKNDEDKTNFGSENECTEEDMKDIQKILRRNSGAPILPENGEENEADFVDTKAKESENEELRNLKKQNRNIGHVSSKRNGGEIGQNYSREEEERGYDEDKISNYNDEHGNHFTSRNEDKKYFVVNPNEKYSIANQGVSPEDDHEVEDEEGDYTQKIASVVKADKSPEIHTNNGDDRIRRSHFRYNLLKNNSALKNKPENFEKNYTGKNPVENSFQKKASEFGSDRNENLDENNFGNISARNIVFGNEVENIGKVRNITYDNKVEPDDNVGVQLNEENNYFKKFVNSPKTSDKNAHINDPHLEYGNLPRSSKDSFKNIPNTPNLSRGYIKNLKNIENLKTEDNSRSIQKTNINTEYGNPKYKEFNSYKNIPSVDTNFKTISNPKEDNYGFQKEPNLKEIQNSSNFKTVHGDTFIKIENPQKDNFESIHKSLIPGKEYTELTENNSKRIDIRTSQSTDYSNKPETNNFPKITSDLDTEHSNSFKKVENPNERFGSILQSFDQHNSKKTVNPKEYNFGNFDLNTERNNFKSHPQNSKIADQRHVKNFKKISDVHIDYGNNRRNFDDSKVNNFRNYQKNLKHNKDNIGVQGNNFKIKHDFVSNKKSTESVNPAKISEEIIAPSHTNYNVVKQNPVDDQKISATAHKKAKPVNEKHEKGGGKESEEKHAAKHEEKGEKGSKSEHKEAEVEHGHHNKEGQSGSYKEDGGDEKKHDESSGYHAEHKGEDGGEKGATYNEDGEHTKGHSTHGSHNVHKKDEYEKREEFYDESDDEGDFDKAGGFFEESDFEKGGSYKESHYDEDDHHDLYGGEKHHEKGDHYSYGKSHKESDGHDVHHDHFNLHKKKQDEGKHKKWLYGGKA